jgi:Cu+-exporting ATPase
MAHSLIVNVSGMHCEACVRRVRAALEKVPGVAVQDVSVGSARLAAQAGTDHQEAIRAAVSKTGFTVESIEEAS